MSRDVFGRIAELRHRRRMAPRLQGVVVLPLALAAALLAGPGAMGQPGGRAASSPSGAAARSVTSDCGEAARMAVEQFRYLRLVELDESNGVLRVKVEYDGPTARYSPDAILMLKTGFDQAGFRALRVKGGPSSDASVVPFEFELACPSAESSETDPPAGPPLGLPCPEEAASADRALRDALAARGGRSPRIEATITREGPELHVVGHADDIPTIETFVGELEACATFATVELRSVKARKDGTYDFDLGALLEGAAR